MENASKALIIAGAILLAIVLVSLGVLVINNARKDINDKNIDEATIETFNKNITQYCGSNKSGTEMNSLMSAIYSSNGGQKNKADKHYIALKTSGVNGVSVASDWSASTIANNTGDLSLPTFDNSHKYKATYKIDSDGFINQVTITNN